MFTITEKRIFGSFLCNFFLLKETNKRTLCTEQIVGGNNDTMMICEKGQIVNRTELKE